METLCSHAYSTNDAFSNSINVRRGSRHPLRGRGSTTFQENLTRKNKKENNNNNNKTRTDREEEVVSAPCSHGQCPASFFGEGRKGRRHDLCVIVNMHIGIIYIYILTDYKNACYLQIVRRTKFCLEQ